MEKPVIEIIEIANDIITSSGCPVDMCPSKCAGVCDDCPKLGDN